ncbi:FkbM family methyltransferase [Leptospira ognonensis]|uniref:FkbM family methyltransferase n=1 Tax=Leptospira ognonensis TaxID=2484945 RepID=UPI0014382A30|nr:FkbM family methyltransferase [Leptospira ognonensis]
MKTIKTVIKSLFKLLGLDISFVRSERYKKQKEDADLKRANLWLTEFNFHSIIDIGANEGQFAKKVRTLFPSTKIISFEPIPTVFEKLKIDFATDQNFKAFNVGLGEKEEKMQLWLNEYSPSSSLLKMDHHTEHFDFAVKQNQIEIQLARLDSYTSEIDLTKPYLVKIDVQGYEDRVIKGGTDVLRKAKMIITEVSFVSLYEGQVLFDQIYSSLKALGFRYVGNYEQLHSPINHSVLQADAIFLREND